MASICCKEKCPWWWVRVILITDDPELRAPIEREHVTFVFQGLSCLTDVIFTSWVQLPAWLRISFFLTAEQHSIVCYHFFIVLSSTEGQWHCFHFSAYCHQSSNGHGRVKIRGVDCWVPSADAKAWRNRSYGRFPFRILGFSTLICRRAGQLAVPGAVDGISLQHLVSHVGWAQPFWLG